MATRTAQDKGTNWGRRETQWVNKVVEGESQDVGGQRRLEDEKVKGRVECAGQDNSMDSFY